MPSFDGTLAAVRCFGERGIPVTVAGATMLAPARWSRYAKRFVSSPPVLEPQRYLDWLLEFGAREPGHVLYPTCDDLAWLFAENVESLSRYFKLYQPGVQSLLPLLDKKALSELCEELGVPCPRTLFPRTVREAKEFGEQLGYPLLIKPRTQMFSKTRDKGCVVERAADLERAYEEFMANNEPDEFVARRLADAGRPILQPLALDAAGHTYSISGFVSREGAFAGRAAYKVMQRPRRVGIGVAFEEAPMDPQALAGLMRLCERTGYFGVFEAEFVMLNGKLSLIDFNPRFYGQMGFEAARALPLPHLAWLGALGETEELKTLLERAAKWEAGKGYVYCNRFFFNLTLRLQSLSGSMSAAERARWQRWLEVPSEVALAFDPIDHPSDPLPGFVSRVRELYTAARHPRSFYRKVIVGSAALVLQAATLIAETF